MRRTRPGNLVPGITASAALLALSLVLDACASSGKGGGTTGTTGAGTTGAGTTGAGTTVTAGVTSTSSSASGSSSGGMLTPGDSVLVHHKHPNRDGVYVQPALTKAAVAGMKQDTAFQATLPDPNDHVYAQPLFLDGGAGGRDLVIVATEGNNVYALDAATGAEVWKTNVGAPVPLATLATCGNIDPYGITGTPVIDFASRTLFLDALVLPAAGAKPKHEIFALSIDSGAVKPGWPVDVGATAKSGTVTFDTVYQGQRGALAVVGGTLFVPYGGLFADCGDYHGWIVAVAIDDPTQVQAWATPVVQGGSWAPGGVSSDGTSVYIATGNTSNAATTWGGGDAVLRFGTGAAFGAPTGYFAPSDWHTRLDLEDIDLGTAPLLFSLPGSTPEQLLLSFGKDGNAYLLDPANLGGIGTSLGAGSVGAPYENATARLAAGVLISAPVIYTTATATYVAFHGNGIVGTGCMSGTGGDLSAATITPGAPPKFQGVWCAAGGAGSPIVTTSDGTSDTIVWNMGADGNGHLNAFDGDTGAPIAFPGNAVTIPNMRRFNAPIAAKGRIFVAADGAVVAFGP